MKLFDIVRCKFPCLITCSCLPTDSVPIQIHSFLLDQRGKRLMFIGPIDYKYTIRCHQQCLALKQTHVSTKVPSLIWQLKVIDIKSLVLSLFDMLALFLKKIFLSKRSFTCELVDFKVSKIKALFF